MFGRVERLGDEEARGLRVEGATPVEIAAGNATARRGACLLVPQPASRTVTESAAAMADPTRRGTGAKLSPRSGSSIASLRQPLPGGEYDLSGCWGAGVEVASFDDTLSAGGGGDDPDLDPAGGQPAQVPRELTVSESASPGPDFDDDRPEVSSVRTVDLYGESPLAQAPAAVLPTSIGSRARLGARRLTGSLRDHRLYRCVGVVQRHGGLPAPRRRTGRRREGGAAPAGALAQCVGQHGEAIGQRGRLI